MTCWILQSRPDKPGHIALVEHQSTVQYFIDLTACKVFDTALLFRWILEVYLMQRNA